ncbi:Vacuolar transporter chaperone 1 [Chlorella vulgaris]
MPTMQPSALTDQLWGTRAHTQGAQYQKPRKIPLRIEPKTYFANERTFLAWLGMATTLGTVSTAIAGFAVEDEDVKHSGGISTGTVELITLTLLPVSIAMIAYALFTFYWRSEFIRRKQVGFFDDKVGPITLAIIVMISLTLIMLAAVKDLIVSPIPCTMSGPPYDYCLLSAACDAPRHTSLCLWAVVAESSVPRPTRGSDMVCNLTLIDPSTLDQPELAAGVELMCFAPQAEQLPHVRRPGDIIRIHRARVDRYNERTQLVGKVGYRGFAFCLFHAVDSGLQPNQPYQKSSQHFFYDEREQGLLVGLRTYMATLNRQQLGGNTTYLRRIMEDMPDACNVPLLGTALPLVVAKSISMELPAVYSWVKFRNLGARVVQGQLQAYFSRNSRWTPWQHEQQPQMQFMEEYRERLSANLTAGWAPDPVAGHDELLAVCTHRECPYSTLRQVLLDTPTARPRCYRVLVRLMDYSPRDPVAMCHTRTECGLPANSSRSNWLYTLKLLVEDATASLDLILFGPDADGFFPGMLPRDLQADHDAATALQQRFQQLLGQGSQRDGGPWMELSIKSYYTDPSRPWQTRQYRVHDSRLQAWLGAD